MKNETIINIHLIRELLTNISEGLTGIENLLPDNDDRNRNAIIKAMDAIEVAKKHLNIKL